MKKKTVVKKKAAPRRPPRTLTVELYESPVNLQTYFRVKAANGEIVLQSEGYRAGIDAVNAITLLKKGMRTAKVVIA